MSHEKEHNIFKHMSLLILACAIPLVVILLIPSLGISGRGISFLAFVLMIILHGALMKYPFSIYNKEYKIEDKNDK